MAKAQTKKPFISLIVPCFNEEMWVASVISSLLPCPSVSEIIAVNDGSTDKTGRILKIFAGRIKIISYKKNHGKGYALAEGVKKAKGEIVVFIDAHHLNVKDSHLKILTAPLIKNQADVILGTTLTRMPDIFWRFTGFRAYRREDLLPVLPQIKKTRYGVEAYLNEVFKKKRQKVIYPPGLVHLVKHQKMPSPQVLDSYLTEAVEITKTLAEIKGIDPKRIKKILDPKKIKSVKALKKAIEEIKDKKVLNLLKKYLLSYLPEL